MKKEGWDLIILSVPERKHLVAELYFNGRCLLVLDREDGRDAMQVEFPDSKGNLGPRMPLAELLKRLEDAASNLAR